MTAAQTLAWRAAGEPAVDGAKHALLEQHPAPCAITGEWCEVTADARRALGANFTDHSLWACGSGRVGQAALWCCSGKGATSPRTWSWLCAPGAQLPDSHPKAPHRAPGLCLTNRASTRPVIDLLAAPPPGEWMCTVAVSGQKHVVPYARTNIGGGEWSVRMEDTDIRGDPGTWRHVSGHVLGLRRLGVRADDILAGTPGLGLKTTAALREWARHRAALTPYTGAPIVDLALWCITKPIMEDTLAHPHT